MIKHYTLEGPALLMSDLHLNGEARDQAPLEALKVIAEGALNVTPRHVLLVGDVFDFNLGYRRSIYAHLLPVYQRLSQLTDQGVSLWIFTGNHDPDPCPHLASHHGVTVLTEPALFTFIDHDEEGSQHSVTALIEHGDLCEASRGKRALCRVARSPWVRWLARRLPPALALALAPKLPAQLNTLRPPATVNAKEPLQHASPAHLVKRWGAHAVHMTQPATPSPALWVMGHFHEARLLSITHPSSGALKALDDEPLRALALLGDWVTLNTCLMIAQGELTLSQYTPPSTPRGAQLQLIERLALTR